MTTPAGPATGTEPDVPLPAFESVEDWIDSYFLPMFRRPLGGQYRWCARWWAHTEAVSRLTALWRAWEAMRLEPATGISDWYSAHLGHHLPILTGPDGPFCQCDRSDHQELKPFLAEPVDYDLLAAFGAELDNPAGPIGTGDDVPAAAFGTVEDWVESYFLPMFRRKQGGVHRWCARWWAHTEAVSRLTALWRAWEAMRLEPATGISDWYSAHLDYHLPILLGPDGPFCQCDASVHQELKPFPAVPVDYDALDGGGGEDPGPDAVGADEEGPP
jgi:Domain of unknown function (DUF4913)